MKRGLLITGMIMVLLAVPALAGVPNFHYKQPSIVPGQSIGGVRVGMTKHQAKAEWGPPDSCTTRSGLTTCAYTLPTNRGPAYVAAYYLRNGQVVAIELDSPPIAGALAKVKRLKTAKKIRVGSPLADARDKYGIPLTGGGEANLSRANLKRNNRCTQFYAPEKPYKTITSITLGICRSVIQLYF